MNSVPARGGGVGLWAAVLASLLAGPAGAQPRPMPRPDALPLLSASRPLPRPEAGRGRAPAEDAAAEAGEATGRDGARDQAEGRGGLCGDPSVRGERVEQVGGTGACGIVRPVRVEAVAGVALEPAPVLACPAVEALGGWLEESAKPAFAAAGEPLVGLGVAAGYVCRNVNYAEDGDISEHALGLAVDVSRFEREGGETVTVLEGWGSPAHGALLRDVFEGACGTFGTVLGPESDEYHQDHFHLGAADRRRAYCPEDYEPGEGEEEPASSGAGEADEAEEEEEASEEKAGGDGDQGQGDGDQGGSDVDDAEASGAGPEGA